MIKKNIYITVSLTIAKLVGLNSEECIALLLHAARTTFQVPRTHLSLILRPTRKSRMFYTIFIIPADATLFYIYMYIYICSEEKKTARRKIKGAYPKLFVPSFLRAFPLRVARHSAITSTRRLRRAAALVNMNLWLHTQNNRINCDALVLSELVRDTASSGIRNKQRLKNEKQKRDLAL